MAQSAGSLDPRVVLNEAAKNLRDQADKDYISARHLYSLGFADQFMWSALQCFEKFLKAMLIYSEPTPTGQTEPKLNIKDYNHNYDQLMRAILALTPRKPDIDQPTQEFIEHVYDMGMNRYSDREAYRRGDELVRLDECVWKVRRWCCPVPFEVPPKIAGQGVSLDRWVAVHRNYVLGLLPGPRQHSGGFIERLTVPTATPFWSKARGALLRWNRWFFVKKRSGGRPPRISGSSVPPAKRGWGKEANELLASIGAAPSQNAERKRRVQKHSR